MLKEIQTARLSDERKGGHSSSVNNGVPQNVWGEWRRACHVLLHVVFIITCHFLLHVLFLTRNLFHSDLSHIQKFCQKPAYICDTLHRLPLPHRIELNSSFHMELLRGHPFMMSTKNQVFDPLPPLSTWAGPPPPLWTSTRGRHEIHTALLKWLVQWPTWPKAEIRLYDSNLFKLYY